MIEYVQFSEGLVIDIADIWQKVEVVVQMWAQNRFNFCKESYRTAIGEIKELAFFICLHRWTIEGCSSRSSTDKNVPLVNIGIISAQGGNIWEDKVIPFSFFYLFKCNLTNVHGQILYAPPKIPQLSPTLILIDMQAWYRLHI